MAVGTISELSRERGFGFLVDGAGRKRFFHRSAVVGGGFDSLRERQQVQFEPRDDVKGLRATNVSPVAARGATGRGGPRAASSERNGWTGRRAEPGQRRTGAPGRSADAGPAPKSSGWRSSLSPFRGDPPPTTPRRRR